MAAPVRGIAISSACKQTIPMKNDRAAKGWWDWDNKIPQHLTGVPTTDFVERRKYTY